MIKNTITNAADVTVLALIDNTYKTGGGPVSIGGTVIQAPKGPVGVAVSVNNDTWQRTFGKPWHPREGNKAEGLRHLAEAAEDCQAVTAVRVVASDALFPSIAFMADGSLTKTTHAYGSTPSAGEGVAMVVYPKDGDPSNKRQVQISAVDTAKKRVTLQVLETNDTNAYVVVETLVFGFDVDDVDDMGVTAFVEDVFENQSSLLDVALGDDVSVASFKVMAEAATFEGGTNGGTPTTQDYIKAWDVFRDDRVSADFMFAAGCYDAVVIGNAFKIADGRHAEFYFDAPPSLKHDGAISWLTEAGLSSRQAKCLHGAYSFIDPYYGGRAVWGYSGTAAAARARGNAIFTGAVPGIHYSGAGSKRGFVNRRGAKSLYANDTLNKDALYTARINPILANSSGTGVVIGDDLTVHYEENYSRFGWVTSITNYLVHRFLEGAANVKFEPDGLTHDGLTDMMTDILESLVTSGALVEPRNPAVDGTEPYILTVEQVEIDLWKVTWEVCPTGAARRIAGQPKLIK